MPANPVRRLIVLSVGSVVSGMCRTLSIKSILVGVVSVGLACGLAILASGGSYALLNSRAPISPAATLTSGTATLTATSLILPNVLLYPGATISAPVTVTNTGSVPLALRVVGLTPPNPVTALSASLTVGLVVGACPVLPAPTWTSSLNTTPAIVDLGTTLPVGGTAVLCVSITLSSAAPATAQGLTATNFGIVIDGIQA